MKMEEVYISKEEALLLSQFREMDYFAVEEYDLPIELMMENAGLVLAILIAQNTSDKNSKIRIGVGNGNNGGGGLVAARRLAAWGFQVNIDAFTPILKELPKTQLQRALKFGASLEEVLSPDIWVDAYLGFSQRLPLSDELSNLVKKANDCNCLRIALDIPTGFIGDPALPYFQANKVLSLAASKKILYHLPETVEIFIADLGIPKSVYDKFNAISLPFHKSNLIKLGRTNTSI